MTRDPRFDLGRCIAALLVVYVHSSVGTVVQPLTETPAWHVANVLNSLGRVAVPLFLMMSGALVIGRPVPDWGAYVRKRTATTMRPYFAGAAFYLAWQYLAQGIAPASAHAYLADFLLGNAFLHLYFLPILLGMYLFAPLLQHPPSDRAMIGTTAVLFAIAATDRHLPLFDLRLGYLSLGACYAYLPFFLSGYVLARLVDVPARIAGAAFVASTALTAALCWAFTAAGMPTVVANFQQYTSVNVILQSLAAFALLMRVRIAGEATRRYLAHAAELMLGVYILHYAVLVQAPAFLPAVPPWVRLVAYPPAVFVLTAIIVRLLRLIPGMRGFV